MSGLLIKKKWLKLYFLKQNHKTIEIRKKNCKKRGIIFLQNNNKLYGKANLYKVTEHTIKKLKKKRMKKLHKISKKKLKSYAGNKKTLFCYWFKNIKKFEIPIQVIYKKGQQIWTKINIKNIKIELM